jgi:hypothetical protein
MRKASSILQQRTYLIESQVFLANDFPSVNPALPISSLSAKWPWQRELDVTNRASAVFNNLEE